MVREAALNIGGEVKEDVEEYLRQLEEHRNACVNEGRYPEAEAVARRMKLVKEEEEKRRRQVMAETHVQQRAAAEEQFRKEAQEFDKTWEVKVQEHNERCRKQEEECISRHASELQQFRENNGGLVFKPKFSSELLNLRTRQEKLVRQKKYGQAEQLRQTSDAQEKVELAGQLDEYRFKVALAEEKLLQRHVREMEALQERLARSKNELLRERERKLQTLTHRYDATKTALDKQQALEMRQLDKVMKETLARAVVTVRDTGPQRPQPFSFETLTLNRPITAPIQKKLTIHESTRTADALARQQLAAGPLIPTNLKAQFSAMRVLEEDSREGVENEPSTSSLHQQQSPGGANSNAANFNPYLGAPGGQKRRSPLGGEGGSATMPSPLPGPGGASRQNRTVPSTSAKRNPPRVATVSTVSVTAKATSKKGEGGVTATAIQLPLLKSGSRLLRLTAAEERRREAIQAQKDWRD